MITRFKILSSCAVFACLVCACNASVSPTLQTSTTASPGAAVQTPTPAVCSATSLQKQFEEIASVAAGPVGVAVLEIETGELVTLSGKQHFPMQSVYKLPIGMAVLQQVDKGLLKLDQIVHVKPADLVPANLGSPLRDRHPQGADVTLSELLSLMVKDSDGTASDVLLNLIGGPDAATKYLRELGVEDIVVATSERDMAGDVQVQYRNWSTPEAMVGLLKLLHEGRGLTAASRTLLLDWMVKTQTFPTRLKGMLPEGTIVAHKTGSSGARDGVARATNDVGLITLPNGHHLAIAVFVSDTKADAKTRDAVIARSARAAWDCWVTSEKK
nr:ClassA_beta_lactamase [uncultured bacterium]